MSKLWLEHLELALLILIVGGVNLPYFWCTRTPLSLFLSGVDSTPLLANDTLGDYEAVELGNLTSDEQILNKRYNVTKSEEKTKFCFSLVEENVHVYHRENYTCEDMGAKAGDRWQHRNNFCQCVSKSPNSTAIQNTHIKGLIHFYLGTCQVFNEHHNHTAIYTNQKEVPSINYRFRCLCMCQTAAVPISIRQPCYIDCQWINGCWENQRTLIQPGAVNSAGCYCTHYGKFVCNSVN
ncbi:uncharacterized protein LOC134848238 [Symsagittifera roscoffensis]|uniref:uncharacterized protein LOC134848238 n=1 Tax=Symsagittifera roscoffensis TaxID=84072 RepID=UPI00307B9C1D